MYIQTYTITTAHRFPTRSAMHSAKRFAGHIAETAYAIGNMKTNIRQNEMTIDGIGCPSP